MPKATEKRSLCVSNNTFSDREGRKRWERAVTERDRTMELNGLIGGVRGLASLAGQSRVGVRRTSPWELGPLRPTIKYTYIPQKGDVPDASDVRFRREKLPSGRLS